MTPDHREAFEERAAILEYDANMPRKQAETEAAKRYCTTCRMNKPRELFKPNAVRMSWLHRGR